MKIVIASEPLAQRADEIRKLLGPAFETIFLSRPSQLQLAAAVADAEVLVTAKVTAQVMAEARSLRLIHTPGAGTDKVDKQALPPGVSIANTYGHGSAIAEHVIMMMLALYRHLIPADQALRQGVWRSATVDPTFSPARGLRKKTVVILGLGTIGLALLKVARVFGMEVMGIRRSPEVDPPLVRQLSFLGNLSDLNHLLPLADFLVVALPLNKETRGVIGQPELQRMKRSAYLINVARAEIVDEAALYHALKEKQIAGAGLDVWYQYPTSSSPHQLPAHFPFWELPTVVMTPHVAGTAEETFDHRIRDIVENVKRLNRGEPLINLVHS